MTDLARQLVSIGGDPALVPVVLRLAATGAQLAHRIARGPLGGAMAEAVGRNEDGDTQKALDVEADENFLAALREAGVRHYASEEQEEAITLDPGGAWAVAIDPLDGSSNIDVNVSIGTIFSIYPAADTPEASFLRPTDQQQAAGYIIYGPQTLMVVTFGQGTHRFILDPDSRQWVGLTPPAIPPETREFAINASNYRAWVAPIRAYVDDLLAGPEGPRGKRFNMRWVASLVAETHRILSRGGVFLYPADRRKGYEQGRLRLLYECAPIAFLVEQAGGRATDGYNRLLGRPVTALHQRTPFVFGSADEVERVTAYHDMPEEEVSPLFGTRGLFRNQDN